MLFKAIKKRNRGHRRQMVRCFSYKIELLLLDSCMFDILSETAAFPLSSSSAGNNSLRDRVEKFETRNRKTGSGMKVPVER